MKSERVSYDVITPSAARGVLEAVYWKPAICWKIDRIGVLNEIAFETFRRNELGGKLSYANAKAAFKSGKDVYISATEERQQRATVLLRNVAYVIEAHFELTDSAGETDTPEKHYNIAVRRLRKGQCFSQPYFGCREFPVDIELAEGMVPKSFYADIPEKDLGFMLYDMDFSDPVAPSPIFYRAVMRNGIINVAGSLDEVVK